MMHKRSSVSRQGTVLVECAIIYPVIFLLTLGLVVGAMGIFRYQEVSLLAREAARYASTHGAQYHKDASNYPATVGGTYDRTDSSPSPGVMWYTVDTSATTSSWIHDIYQNAISPNIVSLDPSYVTVQVGWPPVTNTAGTVVQNSPDSFPGSKVFVTVTYKWFPEVYLVGPFNLTTTSSMPITN